MSIISFKKGYAKKNPTYFSGVFTNQAKGNKGDRMTGLIGNLKIVVSWNSTSTEPIGSSFDGLYLRCCPCLIKRA
jgi:hypothetical protein